MLVPVVVNVVAKAPLVVKSPPRVIFPLLATPVPPLAGEMSIVPVVVPLITGLLSVGVVSDALVANTAKPEPVLSLNDVLNCEELIELAAVP